MKKLAAIQYILSIQGFLPYAMIINSYENNDEIPEELIELCIGKTTESEIKVSNPELSKIISKT